MPRAYLMEQQEEVQLIPDWLKLKMIRSDEMTLVNAALRDLEPPQLVLFIQSFGIPVPSMSKLLQVRFAIRYISIGMESSKIRV